MVCSASRARPWASRDVPLRHILGQRRYALHRDGMRVAIALPSAGDDVKQDHVTFFLNFFDALRRIAPAGN